MKSILPAGCVDHILHKRNNAFKVVWFGILLLCWMFSKGSSNDLYEKQADVTLLPDIIECSDGNFTCNNGDCIRQRKVCDGENSCSDGSDELVCLTRSDECWDWQLYCEDGACVGDTFQCANGKCIDVTLACDKQDDCGDGSDEIRGAAGFKCPMGRGGDICVLPQRHIHDQFVHCNNYADNAGGSKKRLIFECFDGSLELSSSQQCDGVIDCPDLSDECPCEQRLDKLCRQVCGDFAEYGETDCTVDTFVCDKRKLEIPYTYICDGVLDCADQTDELFCSPHSNNSLVLCPGDVFNTTQILARRCDGRPECYDLSDECNPQCPWSTNSSGYCLLPFRRTAPFHHTCTLGNGDQYNLTVTDLCDGKWSGCSPRIPQEEANCMGRFYCDSEHLLSIDNVLECDGFIQCDNGTDEGTCPSRYYCERGEPVSVPSRFVMDGVKDCKFGGDECPRSLENRAVSSRSHLVGIVFFRFWIWFVAFSALFGNGYIIVSTFRKLPELRKANGLSKCNHFLLVNLAAADGTMSIYLFGIAVKDSVVANQYCKVDVMWRTSQECYWLGATSVISSEASVFTLTILTTMRLISIHHPLTTRDIKLKFAVLGSLIAWVVAFSLALLPFATSQKEAFTYGAWIPSKFTSSDLINLRETRRFASLLSEFSVNSSNTELGLDWISLEIFLQENFAAHSIRGLYGYYSEHSVCLPNFYVTRREKMWAYSFTIVLINFVIFVYIAAAYAAIYRRSTQAKVRSTAGRNNKLQMKMIRLVVTDFLCWMPVCIIAFLTFGGAIAARDVIYATTAVVILPINSVLNPLLYSDIPDILWKKCKLLHKTLKSDSTALISVNI